MAWRWLLLTWIALFVLGALLTGQPPVTTLAIGQFGATDDELSQCWFNIGDGATLLLHPHGEPCRLAKDLIGRTGVLTFTPD